MEKEVKWISQHVTVPKNVWPDLNVASWPRREKLPQQLQNDGCSCGLFLMNFVECWTGEMLSDDITQQYMIKFRLKLAVILISTFLNIRRGRPLFPREDDGPGSPNDIVEIDDPKQITTTSRNGKRDRDGDYILGKQDEFLDSISKQNMKMPKEDMIGILCDYIASIDDAATLGKRWVRSFEPYNIALTVKDLQKVLVTNQGITAECFNLGVRCYAYREYQGLKYCNAPITKHFMDLRFCKMIGLTTHPDFRKSYSAKELSAVIGGWSIINYEHLRCQYFLLPWFTGKDFVLYVLDHVDKRITVVDPSRVPKWCEDVPFRKYGETIAHFYQKYKAAMNVNSPSRWDENIYRWKFTHEKGIFEDEDAGYATGYLVLQYMSLWKSTEKMEICTDRVAMRQNFIIDVLSSRVNAYGHLLSAEVKKYLSRINGWDTK